MHAHLNPAIKDPGQILGSWPKKCSSAKDSCPDSVTAVLTACFSLGREKPQACVRAETKGRCHFLTPPEGCRAPAPPG